MKLKMICKDIKLYKINYNIFIIVFFQKRFDLPTFQDNKCLLLNIHYPSSNPSKTQLLF